MIERKSYLNLAELFTDIDKMNVGLDLEKTFKLAPYFFATEDGDIHQGFDLNSLINLLISKLGINIVPWSGVDGVPLSLIFKDYSSCFKEKQRTQDEVVLNETEEENCIPSSEEKVTEQENRILFENMTAKEIIKILTDNGETVPRIINKTQLVKLAKSKFGDSYGDSGAN